jgi:hypothetical protein
MTVFIAPCYTERLNWPLGLTFAHAAPITVEKSPSVNE